MKQRTIGKTDLKVSELCLGTMYFGWNEPRDRSFDRLEQYTAAGGNFIDTANIYAEHHKADKDYFGKDFDKFVDGGSERLIGEWLAKRGNRHELVIATKTGFPYPGVEYGTTAKGIKEECEKSLLRMGTDYIDLFYLHTDDRETPLEESLYALTQLVREGKVRYIGASNFKAWRLAEAAQLSERNGFEKFCCIQQRHSYLRGKTGWDFGGQLESNDDLFDFVRADGMTLLAYSPLLGGYYNNRTRPLMEQYAGADSLARCEALDKVAKKTGATPVQLVYRWMLDSNPSVLPLVASSSREQFEEALGALSLTLSEEDFNTLNNARA